MRYLLIVVGLIVIVGILAGVKFFQISSLMAMGKQMEQMGPPPEAVGSTVAKAQAWEGTLSAVGSVAGVRSVAVSNDAPGIVRRIAFESGAVVEEGQTLVELEANVERAQLESARARRDLAATTAERTRKLVAAKVATQAQLDNDEAQLRTATTDLAALAAQVQRKVVRAPFKGRLGIRAVKVGQYLAPGTMITMLDAIGGVFVDFSLPQEKLPTIKVGMPVRFTIRGGSGEAIEGTISAVDPTVDNVTRSIKLRSSIPDKEHKLRPGMFVNVEVVMPDKTSVVAVPATAVVYAPYGDSVFVVEEKKPDSPGMAKTPDGRTVKVARQQFVRLGQSRGDFVALTEGVKPGQEVVTAGAFKLRNGSPIFVDNTVQAKPELNPQPMNR